jgi:hypothetical protein
MGEPPFAGGLRSEAVSDQLVWFKRHGDCLSRKREKHVLFYVQHSPDQRGAGVPLLLRQPYLIHVNAW